MQRSVPSQGGGTSVSTSVARVSPVHVHRDRLHYLMLRYLQRVLSAIYDKKNYSNGYLKTLNRKVVQQYEPCFKIFLNHRLVLKEYSDILGNMLSR